MKVTPALFRGVFYSPFLFQQLPLAFNLRVFRVDIANFLKVVNGSQNGTFTYSEIILKP